MVTARAVVIIPTLHAGEPLRRCVDSLRAQRFRDFAVIVIDNSGRGVAREFHDPPKVTVIENESNVGFGAAINQGGKQSRSEFVCCLNDDTEPDPGWLEALVEACEARPEAGLCAPCILLRDRPGLLDSSGLDIYPDGTTKQRGHGRPASDYAHRADALLPSGCAALYRRSVLEQTGGFDPDFFLYCEDADLGLRARLAGWECLYVPEARVVHAYSASSGRASRLKAFLVERNRLLTVIKVFPLALWPLAPLYTLARYGQHLRAARGGRGLASEFLLQGESWWRLAIIVVSAHSSALALLPRTWKKRRRARALDRLGVAGFWRLLKKHAATAADVAQQ